jgi:hypothetical protein
VLELCTLLTMVPALLSAVQNVHGERTCAQPDPGALRQNNYKYDTITYKLQFL